MKRLVEEIAGALPALLVERPLGVSIANVSTALGVSVPLVRQAIETLHAEPALCVVVVRYGSSRTLFFRMAGVGFGPHERVCRCCRVVFDSSANPHKRSCSRSCSVTLARRSPEAAKRKTTRGRTISPEWLEKLRASRQRPEARQKQSDASKARWSDPEQRAHMVASMTVKFRTPEMITTRRASMAARWADPEFRDKTSLSIRRNHCSPEFRAQQSEISKQMWRDPEKRERLTESLTISARRRAPRMSEVAKERWSNPETREIMMAGSRKSGAKRRGRPGRKRTPEQIAAQSERTKAMWENPDTRAILAENVKKAQEVWRAGGQKAEAGRAAISAKAKERWADPERRKEMEQQVKRLAESNRGRKRSPEAIAKFKATWAAKRAAE